MAATINFFAQLDPTIRSNCLAFFSNTEPEQIVQYGQGIDLNELTKYFQSAKTAIFLGKFFVSEDIKPQEQWKLDRLSEIKERLAGAIKLRNDYLDNHHIGIFAMRVHYASWARKPIEQPEITEAESYLLELDSKHPYRLIKKNKAYYHIRETGFSTKGLDTSKYFDYVPKQLIILRAEDEPSETE